MVSAGNVIMAYFAGWSVYDRGYNVWDMDVSKISHINYAFANIKEGLVVLGDPYADSEKVNIGRGDAWNDPADYLHGNFHQLFRLKQANRYLKVGLSIGGWSWSAGFSAAAGNERSRKRFVASAIQLIHDLGLDYIDLDWEFPVVGGLVPDARSPNDGNNLVLLLEEFSQQLAQHFPDPQSRPYITIAVSCSSSVYEHYQLDRLEEHVRYFNLMGYDFTGAWSPVSDHLANLHKRPPRTINGKSNVQSSNSVAEAVDYYLGKGVSAEKLILGIPMFGREFTSCHGLQHPFHGVGNGSWEPGLIDYKDIPAPGYLTKWERTTNSSFAINPATRSFIAYDDVKVVAHKMDYLEKKGLGGALFWEISADRPSEDPRSILRMTDAWIGGELLDRSKNTICYPKSKYGNVRNVPGCPVIETEKKPNPIVLRNISKPSLQIINAAIEQCISEIQGNVDDLDLSSFSADVSDRSHAIPSKVTKIIECYKLQLPLADSELLLAPERGGVNENRVDDSLMDLVFEMIDLDKCEKAYNRGRIIEEESSATDVSETKSSSKKEPAENHAYSVPQGEYCFSFHEELNESGSSDKDLSQLEFEEAVPDFGMIYSRLNSDAP